MKARRLWWIIRSIFIRGGVKRADYARKNNIYAHVGQNVNFQPRFIPIYSELISFGNNIVVARNVDFCTHDLHHLVINRLPENQREAFKFNEKIGCIEVCDNVFIGSNSVILYGTKIGPNVIIGSGSVVTKDCEPNSVYAGTPARKIGTLDGYIRKRKQGEMDGTISTTTHNQSLTKDEILAAWAQFKSNHGQEQ